MTARLTAASPIPTGECSGSARPRSAPAEPAPTTAARPKKDSAMSRSARRSRRPGSRPANCHATAAAESTSTPESRPKPTRADDVAAFPAASATTASTTL